MVFLATDWWYISCQYQILQFRTKFCIYTIFFKATHFSFDEREFLIKRNKQKIPINTHIMAEKHLSIYVRDSHLSAEIKKITEITISMSACYWMFTDENPVSYGKKAVPLEYKCSWHFIWHHYSRDKHSCPLSFGALCFWDLHYICSACKGCRFLLISLYYIIQKLKSFLF